MFILSKAELKNMMNQGKLKYRYIYIASIAYKQVFLRISIIYLELPALFNEEQTQKLMDKLDVDGDGSITFEEFVGQMAVICNLFNNSNVDSSDQFASYLTEILK